MASRRTPRRRPQRWSPYDGAASRRRRPLPRTRLWKPLHRDQVASCRPRGARREDRGGAGRGPGPWKRRAAGPRGKPGRRRGDRPREAHRRPREKKREWKGTGRRRGRGSGRLAATGEACRRHPLGFLRGGPARIRKLWQWVTLRSLASVEAFCGTHLPAHGENCGATSC
jgi:hypothetical protein